MYGDKDGEGMEETAVDAAKDIALKERDVPAAGARESENELLLLPALCYTARKRRLEENCAFPSHARVHAPSILATGAF